LLSANSREFPLMLLKFARISVDWWMRKLQD
jgi:hypothetical protein